MRIQGRSLLLASALAFGTGAMAQENQQQQRQNVQQAKEQRNQQTTAQQAKEQNKTQQKADAAEVKELLKGYSNTSREVAEKMIAQYGQPDEATASMLVWHNNGPWKRTVVHAEEVKHGFPMPHNDVLEQTVDLDVDPKHYSPLAEYDGSVVVKRTEGEISARCDKEAMNFLALNLAHDIIQGKRSVEEARKHYAQVAARAMKGDMDEYTQGLRFKPENNTGFRDAPAAGEVIRGLAEPQDR
jgi:hypothetical protein